MDFLVSLCEQHPMLRDGTVLRNSAVTIGTSQSHSLEKHVHVGLKKKEKKKTIFTEKLFIFFHSPPPLQGSKIKGPLFASGPLTRLATCSL